MRRSRWRPRMRRRSRASWRARWTTSRSARSFAREASRGRRPSHGRARPRRPWRRIAPRRGRWRAPEMRVAIDGRKLHDGGIGTYIRGLVGALAAAGPRDDWTLLVDAGHHGGMRWPTSVREREVRAGKYGLAEHWVVPAAARKAGAELLHAPHYTLPLGWSGPSVVTIHDLIHVRFARFHPPAVGLYARAMAGLATRRATAVIADSEATKRDIVELLGTAPARVRVVPLGVSPRLAPAPAVDVALFRSGRAPRSALARRGLRAASARGARVRRRGARERRGLAAGGAGRRRGVPAPARAGRLGRGDPRAARRPRPARRARRARPDARGPVHLGAHRGDDAGDLRRGAGEGAVSRRGRSPERRAQYAFASLNTRATVRNRIRTSNHSDQFCT